MRKRMIHTVMLLFLVVVVPAVLQADYGWDSDIHGYIPDGAKQNRDAVAVVIGNQTYDHADVPTVEYALRDAKLIKQYLIKTLGYREGNIIYKENMTKGDFEVIFGTEKNYRGKLFDYIKEGKSDVFIYYSGHGAPGPNKKEGYFVPREADPAKIKLGGYPLTVFYDNLTKLSARSVTVVIDACFSGLVNSASPVFIKVDNPVIASNNISVLTSSQGDQISSWHDDKEHGLFTFFFANALRGHADANRDKQLTIQEIHHYVSDVSEGVPYYARRLHGRQQTPILIGNKNHVLTELQELPKPVPPPPPPARFLGHVQISVNVDEAKIYFDDKLMGTASKTHPLQVKNTESGEVMIRVEAEGYESQTQVITVKRNEWVQSIVELKSGKSSTTTSSAHGKTLVKHDIEFVYVPGGTFEMGDLWGDGENDEPVHTVELDGFYIGKYEVTNAQYAKFLNEYNAQYTQSMNDEYGSNCIKGEEYQGKKMIDEHSWGLQKKGDKWLPASGYENHPVINVTWYGTFEFCRYYGLRLPTEEEWEYAARSAGKKKEKWSGTNEESFLASRAWYRTNSKGKTHPVGRKKPNDLGLYDMSGNVWEWCQDWYDDNRYFIKRGGSWYNDPRYCRVAARGRINPDDRSFYDGFRVVSAQDSF